MHVVLTPKIQACTAGFVNLWRLILSQGKGGCYPRSTLSLRQPAPCPSSPPNVRIAATSLDGRRARIADAIAGGRVGPWGHTSTENAAPARGICLPARQYLTLGRAIT